MPGSFEERLQQIWKIQDFSQLFRQKTNKPPHPVRRGTILFNEGDPLGRLYLIEEGFVKLYRLSSEGKDTVIYLFGPGDILGIRALLSEDDCAKNSAEAITELKISTISKQEYLKTLIEQPQYLLDLLHVFVNRLNYTERRLEGFIATDAACRVANFLYDCIIRYGQKKGRAITIPIPLTHQRIAEFVGITRETATGAINRLKKEGILTHNRGNITILNLHTLKKYIPYI